MLCRVAEDAGMPLHRCMSVQVPSLVLKHPLILIHASQMKHWNVLQNFPTPVIMQVVCAVQQVLTRFFSV